MISSQETCYFVEKQLLSEGEDFCWIMTETVLCLLILHSFDKSREALFLTLWENREPAAEGNFCPDPIFTRKRT